MLLKFDLTGVGWGNKQWTKASPVPLRAGSTQSRCTLAVCSIQTGLLYLWRGGAKMPCTTESTFCPSSSICECPIWAGYWGSEWDVWTVKTFVARNTTCLARGRIFPSNASHRCYGLVGTSAKWKLWLVQTIRTIMSSWGYFFNNLEIQPILVCRDL